MVGRIPMARTRLPPRRSMARLMPPAIVVVAGVLEIPGVDANLMRALNFFTHSAHCGEFLSLDELCAGIGVTRSGVDDVISAMRGIRFDIRNFVTHPIIGTNRVLCTYPFPLLSQKALVESRARLTTATS